MRLIADQLQAGGWHVHRTQMTGDDDGALVALATLGADLGDDVRGCLFDLNMPWKRKLTSVVGGLGRTGGRTAVLVDDPWSGSPEEAPSLFAERATDLLDEIERTPSLSLVLSRSDRPLAGTVVELPTVADPHAVLASERWQRSSLEHVARELAEAGDARLARLSPVELRLAVALASVKGMNAAGALQRLKTGPHAFVRTVLDALGNARFRSAITRLGVMRTPFDETTLDELLGETTASERGLMLDALLFRTDDGFVVPELLARVAKERLYTLRFAELKEAHLVAARFHERGFTAHARPASVSRAIDLRAVKRHEMEIEQYDKLGKTLSIRGVRASKPALLRLAVDGVDAYDRALAHDPDDAYAHHYRAYNLDVLADDPAPVEAGYRRALMLRPDHVWHHRLPACSCTAGGSSSRGRSSTMCPSASAIRGSRRRACCSRSSRKPSPTSWCSPRRCLRPTAGTDRTCSSPRKSAHAWFAGCPGGSNVPTARSPCASRSMRRSLVADRTPLRGSVARARPQGRRCHPPGRSSRSSSSRDRITR